MSETNNGNQNFTLTSTGGDWVTVPAYNPACTAEPMLVPFVQVIECPPLPAVQYVEAGQSRQLRINKRTHKVKIRSVSDDWLVLTIEPKLGKASSEDWPARESVESGGDDEC